jgi:hypothetical protein
MAMNAYLDVFTDEEMATLGDITDATEGRIIFWCHPALPYDCAVMMCLDGDMEHSIEVSTQMRGGKIHIGMVTVRLHTFDILPKMINQLKLSMGHRNVFFKWCD